MRLTWTGSTRCGLPVMRSWSAPAPSAATTRGCWCASPRAGLSGQRRASRPARRRSPLPAAATWIRGRRFFAADSTPLVYAAAGAAGRSRAPAGRGGHDRPVPAPIAALAGVLADLAARGVGRLLVEGGSVVLGQFLAAGLADEFRLAVAPVFVGRPGRAPAAGGRAASRAACGWPGCSRSGDMAVLRYLPGGSRRLTTRDPSRSRPTW